MAKVCLAFRGHGNVSNDDARTIATCAAALRAACEAAGIDVRGSVDASLDAEPVTPAAVEPEAPVQEFAVIEVPEVAAVRTGKPGRPRR